MLYEWTVYPPSSASTSKAVALMPGDLRAGVLCRGPGEMMLRLLRPELLNGNEMPVTGMMPIVIQTFTNTWYKDRRDLEYRAGHGQRRRDGRAVRAGGARY